MWRSKWGILLGYCSFTHRSVKMNLLDHNFFSFPFVFSFIPDSTEDPKLSIFICLFRFLCCLLNRDCFMVSTKCAIFTKNKTYLVIWCFCEVCQQMKVFYPEDVFSPACKKRRLTQTEEKIKRYISWSVYTTSLLLVCCYSVSKLCEASVILWW